MKIYIKPILVVIVSAMLLFVSSCQGANESNDGYISPEEFIEMNTAAAQDGFWYPFTLNEAKEMSYFVCSMLKTIEDPMEFSTKLFFYTTESYPELSAEELGQFAAYVATYTCLSDARVMLERVL